MLPPSSADTLLDRVVAGRFRMVRQLGAGGMGAVYLAEQINLKREVAIKVLKPGIVDDAFRARFTAEAMATSRLNHPNIITVHDFGIDTAAALPLPWLALEKLEGQSLRERISARGRLPVADGIAVLIGIAAALAEAHAAHIIHRDLKPENVFLVDRNDGAVHVKVLDFGIAKILDLDGAHTQTQTGAVVGTPGYVAPERMQTGHEDARGDLYALGVVAFEIFTGRAPFEAPTPLALALKHMLEPPPHLNAIAGVVVPEALDAFVAALLAKTAEGRPASAHAARETLRALAAAPAVTSATRAEQTPHTAVTPIPQHSKPVVAARVPMRAAAVTAALIAVAIAAWWFTRGGLAERAARADAHGDVPAAAEAWWRACGAGDAVACRSLGTLAVEHPGAVAIGALDGCAGPDGGVIDACQSLRWDLAQEAWKRGCAGNDAPSCLAQGRVLERSHPSWEQVATAANAYNKACKAGLLLACFHEEVLRVAGAELARVEGGTISVTPDERAAAEADCARGTTDACFAVSLIDIRKARIADHLDDVVAIRKQWRAWCDGPANSKPGAGFGPACTRLLATHEAEQERELGDAAKDPTVAAGHYLAAQMHSPDYTAPLYGLAAIAATERHDDDALAYLRRAFKLEPALRRDVVGDARFERLRTTPGYAALRGE
jgi:TPR repeat protein